MGDVHVGVRFDDVELFDRARSAYSDHLIEDPQAIDDLSVCLHPQAADGPVRRRPSLRHGGCDLVRSASPDRLLRALDCFLGGVDRGPGGSVPVRNMGAVIRGDRASLVPSHLLDRSSGVERRIIGSGGAIADEVATALDPISGEVVVAAGLAGMERLGITGAGLAPAGRYRLVRVHWGEEEVGPDERPALGVVRLLGRIGPVPAPAPEALLGGVVALAGRFGGVGVGTTGHDDLDAVLAELA